MIEQIAVELGKYMDVLVARQSLVTSNIANIDTPDYRTVDLDFQQEYRCLLAGETNPFAVEEVMGLRIKNDGNNVNMDRELRMLAEDSIRFAAVSSMAQSEISQLKSAIDNLQG
jgi:flagellar basal-body rod protein FlgB